MSSIGTAEERNVFFEQRLDKFIQLRDELADIEDAGIELILGRLCANISRVTHLLRAHGCHLCPQLVAKFDDSTLPLLLYRAFSVAISTNRRLYSLYWD